MSARGPSDVDSVYSSLSCSVWIWDLISWMNGNCGALSVVCPSLSGRVPSHAIVDVVVLSWSSLHAPSRSPNGNFRHKASTHNSSSRIQDQIYQYPCTLSSLLIPAHVPPRCISHRHGNSSPMQLHVFPRCLSSRTASAHPSRGNRVACRRILCPKRSPLMAFGIDSQTFACASLSPNAPLAVTPGSAKACRSCPFKCRAGRTSILLTAFCVPSLESFRRCLHRPD